MRIFRWEGFSSALGMAFYRPLEWPYLALPSNRAVHRKIWDGLSLSLNLYFVLLHFESSITWNHKGIWHVALFFTGQSEREPVLCLKCCLTSRLEENLKIPLINKAREKALALAAQQRMSAVEYERRLVTGTLESSSVRVAVAALGLSRVEVKTQWTE